MNTLRDTDEGKATPSVWPVYVAAVVVLVIGLTTLVGVSTLWYILTPIASSPAAVFKDIMLAQATLGLFGVVTAIGMFRLRGWGWWCGSLFAGVWIVWGLLLLIVMMSAAFFPSHGIVPAPRSFIIGFLSTYLVVASLLLWVLTARRRLFFPPKTEGEE